MVYKRQLADRWNAEVARVLREATLTVPKTGYMQRGGREGKHTEHLGHMLSEMQIVARSHPGASW
jgi:ring-1,2-phenylacetyl-CoA epoxidase subunit PaaC